MPTCNLALPPFLCLDIAVTVLWKLQQGLLHQILTNLLLKTLNAVEFCRRLFYRLGSVEVLVEPSIDLRGNL